MRFVLAILAAFLFVSVATASYYYQANDGYWYYYGQTQAYTRTWVTTFSGGYVNGCYYPSSGYWQYTPYYPVATTASYADNIDTQMLKIVADREKYASQIAKSQALHQQIVEKAKLYNLDKSLPAVYAGLPFPVTASYASLNPYTLNGSYYNTLTPINANTQYGYSYNALSQLYGDTNLNQLYQLSAQLVSGAQKLAGDANTQFNGNVQAVGAGVAKEAEIRAKERFAVAMMQNMAAAPSVSTTGITFSVTPGNNPTITNTASPDVKAGILKAWGDHAAISCSQCHFGSNVKGGFDLQNYLTMSMEEKQKRVWPRILPQADPKIRMPRNPDGSAGHALTPQQYQWWVMVQPDSSSPNSQSK